MSQMRIQMGMSRRGSGGAPPPDFVALVQTLLSGTAGWATDPADTAINFTDTAGTVPVSSPGVSTVARANSKFGTTAHNWQNATGTQQYLWHGASWGADGVDDLLATTGWTALNAALGLSFTIRFRVDSLATARRFFSCSGATGTSARFQFGVQADGSLMLTLRRVDGGTGSDFLTATGLVTTGVSYTAQCTYNALTGAYQIFLNGASVGSGTFSDFDGVNGFTASNSARCRWGLNTSNTLNDWFSGRLGAAVMAVSVLSSGDLANCRGFVERNAL